MKKISIAIGLVLGTFTLGTFTETHSSMIRPDGSATKDFNSMHMGPPKDLFSRGPQGSKKSETDFWKIKTRLSLEELIEAIKKEHHQLTHVSGELTTKLKDGSAWYRLKILPREPARHALGDLSRQGKLIHWINDHK